MTIERKLAAAFQLNDESWMKHANPISVYTRYTVLPVLVLAIWTRAWLGWWSLLPVTLAMLWLFFNPILFDKPASTKNWASRAVMGERIYLNRDRVALPAHHQTPLYAVLNTLSSAGLLLAIWAALSYSLSLAILGITLAYLGKSWFLDRMVWLYQDMKQTDETYQSWEY